MITIYAPNATDFSTLGLGALAPYECTVEEQAGGMYELSMTHPMDEAGKWLNIGVGCILKAPAPVRETPLADEDADGEIPTEPVTVTRKIYKVQTNTGANLHLRQGPSTSTRILSKYRPGTEVVVLSQASGWGQVIVRASGAAGYMSMQYLVYVRDETETIAGDAPSPERVVYPVQSRMQLFRIYKVERDAAEREVRVEARHIFYDLLGDPTKNEYAPEGAAANTVVEELFERALDPHGFTVHSQLTGTVTGEYTRRGLVECLLDPDDGVLPQTNGRLIRDNFDIWLLPDLPRETGVTIRHGKNLLGATLTTDWDSLVTRIIPVGQDKEGKPLLLEGTTYIDSPHIGDYPVIRAQAVEYDVKVGQEGINNAAQARAKLTELAEADFSDNGVDLPTVGLDVDFVALGETEEYKKYADLEAVHLYDTVRVIAKSAGIDAAVRVTGYKWDALGRKYESVTLGEITDLKTTVYGYELPNQGIKTVKIAPGAVGSAQLRDLAVQYAHINTAAVEQLSANSITALKAYIHELVAESITTDQLYADIATIALAQITTANIENANIDWAQIGTLAADIATIAKAHLGDVDIDWAQIENLTATVAEIAKVEIGEAVIDGAQITDGTITNAKIENAAIDTAKIALGAITTALIATGAVGTAQIADGSITSAKIVSLDADVINAGTLSVDRLLLKGPDGLFVAINATDEGLTSEQLSQEEYQSAISGTVLVARSVTADKIAAKSITANEIAAGTITTAELAAESVDASKIKAGSITTSHVAANFGETLDISSNKQVEIIAGNVQQAQETADSAQEAAEQAAPYISATPPEEAPEAGKLWLDEGVEPSVLRKWRGADVTTEREYEEIRTGSGKNLLKNTQEFTGVAGASTFTGETYNGFAVRSGSSANISSDFIEFAQWDDAVDAELGKTYTFSFWAKGSGKLYAFFYRGNDNQPIVVTSVSSQGESAARADGQIFFTLSGDWERYCVKWTISGTGDMTNPKKAVLLRLYKTDSATASVCGAQLEEGSEATNYEPRENTPSFALDNAQGQIESVAVEAGCRARQAGNGQRRNLFKNTQAFTGVDGLSELTGEKYNGFAIRAYDGPTTAEFGEFARWSGAIYPKLNGIYTFSFWAKGTGIIDSYFFGAGTVAVSHVINSQGVESANEDGNSKFTLSSTWTRYWVQWTLSGDGDITVPKNVLLRLFSGNNSASVCGAQLEEGSILTDWTPAPGDYAPITGRESVEIAACGKNLVDLGDLYVSTSNVGMSLSGDSVRVYTTGDGGTWLGAHTPVFTIHAGVPYTLSATLDAYVSGNARIGLRGAENNTFLSGITLVFGSGTGSLSATFTPNADEEVYLSLLCTNDTTLSGDCTFSNIQLEMGNVATEYEPYRSIGGGTVTPTEPLYGLPGAEDTVEMSTDGDVTVTRRTGVKILTGTENWSTMSEWNPGSIAVSDILPDCKPVNDTSEVTTARCSHFPAYTANSVVHVISGDGFAINYGTGLYIRISGCETVDDCKAYLAAQYAAGTPVTIVYELAASETEALTAISPIAPQPGQINLATDADALTATIHGSGWETVNDTSSIQDALANLDGDLASLINEVGLLNGEVGSIAQQIISPDGIKNIVFESSEYQAMVNTVEVNANELSVTQATVTDINGRVETIEGTVRISGSNIDIGRSDSNVQLHLDNTGWSISEGGQETIYARQNRVVAPRFQTTSLIFGALAFNSSGGHFRLMKYGG